MQILGVRCSSVTEQACYAAQVEQLLSGEGSRAPTFAKIHGNNSNIIKAADLDLMRCWRTPTYFSVVALYVCMGTLHFSFG